MNFSIRKKVSYRDGCTETDVPNVGFDVSLQTDGIVTSDAYSETNVFVTCDVTTDVCENCDRSAENNAICDISIETHLTNVSVQVQGSTATGSTGTSFDSDLNDIARHTDIDSFNFPNLTILQMKSLHLKLNDKVAFKELVSNFSFKIRDPGICPTLQVLGCLSTVYQLFCVLMLIHQFSNRERNLENIVRQRCQKQLK